MKEKNKSVKNIIEEIWHWICFDLVVASVIYIVFKITINHMKVGQTIKITYEKAHPSNSMYERCVSQ